MPHASVILERSRGAKWTIEFGLWIAGQETKGLLSDANGFSAVS
jgi:hypothetical protein